MQFFTNKRTEIAFVGLIVLFCLFLFRDIIFGGHLLFTSDFVAFYLGLKQFLYAEMQIHNTIPYWNPYLFGGMPFLAHFESTIFYPLDFLFFIILPERAHGYTLFVHLALAGIFMYSLSRSLQMRPVAGFLAALVFMGNGFVMANLYMGQMFRLQAYTWIPLILLFLKKATGPEKPHLHACMAGVFWGIQILAGAPQDSFYTFLAALLFILCQAVFGKGETIPRRRMFTVPVIFFLTGAGLSAIQTIPAFEFISQSVRAAHDHYDLITMASYPPEGVITSIMPHFFGSFLKDTYWVSNVPWSIPQQNLYVGILPLFLFPFIQYCRPENKRLVIFLLLLVFFSLILALGRHTPLYRLVYLFPGFDRFRAPSKITILWVFSLSLLAGKGFHDLFIHEGRAVLARTKIFVGIVLTLLLLMLLLFKDNTLTLKLFSIFVLENAMQDKMLEASHIIINEFGRLVILTAAITLTFILWVRGVLGRRMIPFVFCGILVLDLTFTHWGAVRHSDAFFHALKVEKKGLKAVLEKDGSIFRVGSFLHDPGPNIEMYYGFQSVGGYTPLFLSRYLEYFNAYSKERLPSSSSFIAYTRTTDDKKRLMDLLNVKYEIDYSRKQYTLRETCLPRAFFIPECRICKRETVLETMVSPQFNPMQTVLIEATDFIPAFEGHTKPIGESDERSDIVSYRPDAIMIKTETDRPGFLFLGDIFYPGWKAFIDGKPTRILRGNYLFRVVEIPDGCHTVRFVFNPLSLRVGLAISCLTTIFIILVFMNNRKKSAATPTAKSSVSV